MSVLLSEAGASQKRYSSKNFVRSKGSKPTEGEQKYWSLHEAITYKNLKDYIKFTAVINRNQWARSGEDFESVFMDIWNEKDRNKTAETSLINMHGKKVNGVLVRKQTDKFDTRPVDCWHEVSKTNVEIKYYSERATPLVIYVDTFQRYAISTYERQVEELASGKGIQNGVYMVCCATPHKTKKQKWNLTVYQFNVCRLSANPRQCRESNMARIKANLKKKKSSL